MGRYTRGRYGDISKIAYEYVKKINKKVETVDEAIENAREILGIEVMEDGTEIINDDFWLSVFEQDRGELHRGDFGSVKLCINTTDMLYSEMPIAKSLEAFASNILDKDNYRDENGKKLKIYHSEELFKKALKEDKLLKDVANGSNGNCVDKANDKTEFIILSLPKNYKMSKNYDLSDIKKIREEFGTRYQTIDDYCKTYLSINDKMKNLRQALTKSEGEDRIKITNEIRSLGKFSKELKYDIEVAINELIRPIKWKQPLKDSGEADYSEFDFFDPKQVKALLQVHRGNDLTDELTCLVLDLNRLIKECDFTEPQWKVLRLWRLGCGTTQIAEKLEIKQQYVSSYLDTAINKIINQYEHNYTYWYYLNIRKGQYKKCKCCGKVKLTLDFTKNNQVKDGLSNKCKICQKK